MSQTPENQNELHQLKQALVALKKARTRLDTIEKSQKEPIAIIGMSCRFPGGANSPDAFWRLLESGTDAISEVPGDRWNIDALYDPDPAAPGKMSSRWGGFIDEIDQFDANFFGISPREAAQMDPQQRLILEVAWEALEDAGLTKMALSGSQTGVYVGVHSHSADYLLHQYADPAAIDIYTGTGTAHNVLAGRLAYLFNLRGPAITVDTACSSSLVAVHLACQTLRNGESQMMLVAGVNLVLTPDFTIAASKMHMLAPDGRCKAFDSRANGFVRGEGCGVVILKRLSDALAAGDPILAVIRGSAINQDGHTNGLTAPNGLSQRQVIERALDQAGVKPSQVGYIEAHGTGTSLGDVIELETLSTIFGGPRDNQTACFLGSAKANIGHLEGAAGIAGLIKAVLSLQKKAIPPIVHFQTLNPNISLEDTCLSVPTKLRPWLTDQKRLAGISSFGWSGTNAHVVVEEAPPPLIVDEGTTSIQKERVYLLPISAQSMQSLNFLATSYQGLLSSKTLTDINPGTEPGLEEICYTASLRRSHHEYRLSIIGQTRQDLSDQINGFLQGNTMPGATSGQVMPDYSPRIAFVFPGQGSQWVGMGRELFAREPVFRNAILECEKAIKLYADWELTEQLQAAEDTARLNEIDVIQPTLFAIQVALAALWRSWGITPDAVIGHSMGEIAAAHIAGALDLQSAAQIICTRSRLLRRVSGQGVMAVVGVSLDEAQQIITNYEHQISVAVSNSPRSTVLSGDPSAMEKLFEELRLKNIFYRLVKVDVASHSPQMEPLLPDLLSELRGLQSSPAAIPLYSTVVGNRSEGLSFNASYWANNLRKPVLFSKMVEKLLEDGHTVFIEISPHPILLPAIEETLHHLNKNAHPIASLLRNEGEQAAMLSSLGKLYTIGYGVDWKKLYPTSRGLVSLPKYPWEHQRYWIKTSSDRDGTSHQAGRQIPAESDHPLLGTQLPSLAHLPDSHIWQTKVDASFCKYLEDNQIESPIEAMLFTAANSIFGEKNHLITESHERQTLNLDANKESLLQLILTADNGKPASFQLYEQIKDSSASWNKLADGQMEVGQVDASWFYNLHWEAKPFSKKAGIPGDRPGHWLIFNDRNGLGRKIADQIESNGQSCSLVSYGNDHQLPGNDYVLNPNDPEGFGQALRGILGMSPFPLQGVLYLWGLDAPENEELEIGLLKQAQMLTSTGLLQVIQSLLRHEQDSPPRVWVVTRGVQPVAETKFYAVAQSLLWGLGRGIALEHPELWGGLLDLSAEGLSPESLRDQSSQIVTEIFGDDPERQVAFRGGQRYVARLVRDDRWKTKSSHFTIRPDASYLITGGLGRLGIDLARWLVDQGAKHLLLTSRTGLPPRAEWDHMPPSTLEAKRIEAIRSLESQGVTITVVKADSSDMAEMSGLFERLRTDHPPLRGIFHVAGLEVSTLVKEMTIEGLNETLRSKVTGSWILHELTRSTNHGGSAIDFLVMFSSIASIWGPRGLAHYAAANHFMDTLAHHRRSCGLPALSVNWGLWETRLTQMSTEQGMAAVRDLLETTAIVGLAQMSTNQGLAAMKYLLQTDSSQAVVASVDWNKFKPIYEARQKQPLLEHITLEEQAVTETLAADMKSTLTQQLRNMSPQEQREALLEHVRRQAAEVLGLESAEALDIQQGFFRLGMDSITTVRLRNRLEKTLQYSLPPTVAFEYPSVESLTEFLAREILSSDQVKSVNQEPDRETVQASDKQSQKLNDLSRDELFALLDNELSGIDKLTEGD